MTRSIFMSRPRAATSVAMSTCTLPDRKASMVFSRVACGMSPWRGLASYFRLSAVRRSSHSALVSQKTITLALAPAYMAITSLIVAARVLQWDGMAMCRTSVEALTSRSPTRSTVRTAERMYCGATSRTHAGMVAEKRHVWRSGCVQAPRMADMSSAKPMSSIWSASSRVANRTAVSASVPRSMWSLMRPGVPASTSMPARRADTWGPMGAPPYTQSTSRSEATPPISRLTCCASSRVGAMTSPSGGRPRPRAPSAFHVRMRSTMGRAKARVLPMPVRARPMRSFPS
mmetsp:Transcript_13869/g.46904  ORF Transcript_13869/g.46904 Transcript_13869/m.46904 type:complete len:287 (-) Transcript_13869:459-1319(-)